MLLFLSGVARILHCVALIIVPIGALWVSRSTGADGFFVPTRLHVFLILTPAISAIATLFGWRRLRMSDDPMASGLLVKRTTKAVRRSRGGVRAVVGFLQGVALVVSAAYVVVFFGILRGGVPTIWFVSPLLLIVSASLVVLFPSVLGFFCALLLISFFLPLGHLIGTGPLYVVYFSFWFLFLPPHFCVLGVALVRRLMIRRQDVKERFFSRSLLAGLCVGGLLIVVAEAPRTVTRYVISEHRTAGAPLAITPLRYLADWETLISAAEGKHKRIFFGQLPHLSIFGKSSPQLAREAIARLTGEEPTLVIGRYRRGSGGVDFSEEETRGSQIVGNKIDELSLASSTLRGSIESDTALGHFEWEMTFQNDSSRPQEVRAEISLPVDGVVSRASLWVNGVEQEAAITAKGRAQATYRRIVVRNRDPLLVSEVAPGTVFLQCFPVPPAWQSPQNTMKIKIEITAPVQLGSLTTGTLSVPRLKKMNFSVANAEGWVEAKTPISAAGGIQMPKAAGVSEHDFRMFIPFAGVVLPSGPIEVSFRRDASTLQSGFLSGTHNAIIEQSFRTSVVPLPPSLVLVIDGSAVMKERLSMIAEFVDNISPSTNLSVYFAGDRVEELVKSQTIPTDRMKGSLKERLRQYSYRGATDNGVALLAALQEAQRLRDEDRSLKQQPRVVWLHAQQPYQFESFKSVGEYLSKNESTAPIISIQTDSESSEIGTESVPIRRVDYRLTSSEALSMIRCRLLGTRECIEREYTVKPASQIPPVRESAGLHIAHLWGAREVRRMANEGATDEAIKLASELRLVTPMTSAIVLESDRDYEESGITPPMETGGAKAGATSGTIPTTPEPEDIALIALLVILTGFTVLHHRFFTWANHG